MKAILAEQLTHEPSLSITPLQNMTRTMLPFIPIPTLKTNRHKATLSRNNSLVKLIYPASVNNTWVSDWLKREKQLIIHAVKLLFPEKECLVYPSHIRSFRSTYLLRLTS